VNSKRENLPGSAGRLAVKGDLAEFMKETGRKVEGSKSRRSEGARWGRGEREI